MAEQIFDTNPTKQVLVDYAAKSLAPYTLLECITDSSYVGAFGMGLINSYINSSILTSLQGGDSEIGLKQGQYMVIWDSTEGDVSASRLKVLKMSGGSSQSGAPAATTVFGGDGGIYDRVKYAESLYITPENITVGGGSNVPEGKYIPYIQQASGVQTTMYLPAPGQSTGNQALIYNSTTGIGWGAAGAVLNSVPSNDSNRYYLIGATASDVVSLNGTAPSNLYFNQGVFFKGGALYHTSDETLKTFITDIDINFDNLATIKKGFFYWNEDPDKIVNVGVSAQTVEALYPQLVTTEMGFKAVDYSKLGVIALAAVDKLYERIQELEKQIETLKKSKN